jgi:hypothetical protein
MDEDLLRDLDDLDGGEEDDLIGAGEDLDMNSEPLGDMAGDEDLEDLVDSHEQQPQVSSSSPAIIDATAALLESVKNAEQIQLVAKLTRSKQYTDILKVRH